MMQIVGCRVFKEELALVLESATLKAKDEETYDGFKQHQYHLLLLYCNNLLPHMKEFLIRSTNNESLPGFGTRDVGAGDQNQTGT